jgi:type VI protein secretion system component VasK
VIVIVVMVVAVVAMLVPMFVPTFVAVIAMFVPMFVAVVAMLVTMVFTIVRNVSIGVPVMPYEVDRLAAGVVLAAVMAPIALIAWAYMQIDWRRQHAAMNAYAHDGRAIDEAGRRRVADIHASEKAGLAQGDGGRHLCECCAADCQRCKARGEK